MVMMMNPGFDPITFGEVGGQLHALGWRPLPVLQREKRPFLKNWNRWNQAPAPVGEFRDLIHMHGDQACGLAVPADQFIVDTDDDRDEQAADLLSAATAILGQTPLQRVGRTPKRLLVYRAPAEAPRSQIRSRSRWHLDIMRGTGQFVAFGIHNKTERPYAWVGDASPLEMRPDNPAIPLVTPQQVAKFWSTAGEIIGVPPSNNGDTVSDGGDVHDRLRRLARRHGWRRAFERAIEAAVDGERHFTRFAVISRAVGIGMADDEILGLFAGRIAAWDQRTAWPDIERILRAARDRANAEAAVANRPNFQVDWSVRARPRPSKPRV